MKDNREPALDPVEITLILLALAVLTCIWPALVWHGYGGVTGTDWRWDIHSTIACGVWWGFLLTCGTWGFLAHVNSPAMKAREEQERRQQLWRQGEQPDLRRYYRSS